METVITKGIVPRVGFYGATVTRATGQKELWLLRAAAFMGIRSRPPASEGPRRFWPAYWEDRLVDEIQEETLAEYGEEFPRYELPYGYGDVSYWEMENC